MSATPSSLSTSPFATDAFRRNEEWWTLTLLDQQSWPQPPLPSTRVDLGDTVRARLDVVQHLLTTDPGNEEDDEDR